MFLRYRSALLILLLLVFWPQVSGARLCQVPDRLPPPKIRVDWRNPSAPVDYLVFVLSWSPEFCFDRGEGRRQAYQCQVNRFTWVVHGLWPQSEKARSKYDHPRFCRLKPLPSRKTAAGIFCLMPSVNLIYGEWLKHGTCAFDTPKKYFDTIANLWERIKRPDMKVLYSRRGGNLRVGDVEQAFVSLNGPSGLRRNGIMVWTDKKGFLEEVKICLTSSLDYRACPNKRFNASRKVKIRMP